MDKLIPAFLLLAAGLVGPVAFAQEPEPSDDPPGHEGPSFGRTGAERRSGAAGSGSGGEAQPAAPAAKPVTALDDTAPEATPPRARTQAARAPRVETVEQVDQAAMEEKIPHEGPTFGQSRVERRRAKCGAEAKAKGLAGAELDRHLAGCVKR